jgi:hypothetical protein
MSWPGQASKHGVDHGQADEGGRSSLTPVVVIANGRVP